MAELNLQEKIEKVINLAPKLDLEHRMKVLTLINILNPSLITEHGDGSRINLDRLPEVQIDRIYNLCIKYAEEEETD